jgi:hypothetical protein
MSLLALVVAAVVTVLLLFVGLAVGARRLLGLPFGGARALLAGLVGLAAWAALVPVIRAQIQQQPFVFLGAATGSMAVLLLGTAGGPSVTRTVSFYQLLGYNLLVVSAVLVLRVLFTIFRPRR